MHQKLRTATSDLRCVIESKISGAHHVVASGAAGIGQNIAVVIFTLRRGEIKSAGHAHIGFDIETGKSADAEMACPVVARRNLL